MTMNHQENITIPWKKIFYNYLSSSFFAKHAHTHAYEMEKKKRADL